jgi:nicotinate-nucleotide pyrophosphorylase (carboxylating)
MKPEYITASFLHGFISSAFEEDVGDGDHSTLSSIPEKAQSSAQLIVKDDGIIAGVELALEIFRFWDPKLKVAVQKQDSAPVKFGDIALTVSGSSRSILTTERLVLNCMQRMSGIATLTARLSKLIEGTGCQLLDTRKTTPNFRLLEKWAVRIGGGENHRMGLYDMVMLKDNHIDMAGGIAAAIHRTKEYLRDAKKDLRIEVETRTVEEVKQVLETGGVDMIMLDNMKLPVLREAIALIAGRCKTEASGGITEDTIAEVARSGVNYISVGALTHSVKSLDLSLKAIK